MNTLEALVNHIKDSYDATIVDQRFSDMTGTLNALLNQNNNRKGKTEYAFGFRIREVILYPPQATVSSIAIIDIHRY